MTTPSNKDKNPPLELTKEQAKLLESALRIQILRVLAQEPCTSKQVADVLERTPGNVHYHMQKLADAGLIELVDTQPVKGVTEKYYSAKTTQFKTELMPLLAGSFSSPAYQAFTYLFLTNTQREQFQGELNQLLDRWEALATSTDEQEYAVQFIIAKHKTVAPE